MNFLFLYTELADYFINCCKHLTPYGNVHIVRWPVNKEAPFQFEFPSGITVYEKNNYSIEQLHELVKKISPDVIVCSGWIDKDYLRLVKPYFGKVPTVITFDTHWNGKLKQHAATLLSRIFLKNRFSHAWVPGDIQEKYALKLGFSKQTIKKGFYTCDLSRFNTIYSSTHEAKEKQFPKRFLYTGRYYDFKGITDLWEAFIQLQNENPNDWELWCLGNGSIEPVKHPKIKHFGFVQPKDLEPIIKESGVFVLPSRFEPWGVVVQEYAAAGFPLTLSDSVGAKDAFLTEGVNGFSFGKENISELKKTLKKVISLQEEELLKMSKHSHVRAQTINPDQWVKTITTICNEFRQK